MDLDDVAQKISSLSDHWLIQGLSQSILDWKQEIPILLYVLLAFVIGYAVGRYRVRYGSAFQNHGEVLLSSAVRFNFGPPDYHLMNHVTLRLKDGTTELDHILVSRFGVFVIETKDYRGWIFANANNRKWTQVLFKRKFRFQNPIFQNGRHVRAVRGLLDFLPASAIKSAVVFTGDAEFKTDIPEGVYHLEGCIEFIRSHSEEVMSLNRVQFCVGRLETARLAISGETDVEHVHSLEQRHGGVL